MHLLVYGVNEVRTKEGVTCGGLVIFPIELVNVVGSLIHGLSEGTFRIQLIPCHSYKVSFVVPESLCGVDHMDMLVQQLPGLFRGEAVVSYRQQYLKPHCVFLRISGPANYVGVKRGDSPVGSSGSGIANMWPWSSLFIEVIQEVEVVPCVGQGTVGL